MEHFLYPFTCPFVLKSYSFECILDNPPPHSCGPLGQNVPTSHVRTATARTVVSQSQAPPVVSGGHILVSGLSHSPSQGVPHILNYGASHGTSHGTPYGASHGKPYGP